jgi:anti-anti-sigma factor
MLKVKLKTFRGNTAVVRPQGRLVFGGMRKLRNAMNGVIGGGYRHIIIDLAEVEKIDAAALGELVRYYTQAGAAGACLALSNPTRRIRDVLVLTKLLTVFPIIELEVLGKAA